MTLEELLGAATYDPGAAMPPGHPDLAAPYPSHPLELAKVGIRLRSAGTYDRAEQVFQKLMDEFPSLVYGWQEMAVLRCLVGQPDEALRLFRRALEIDPADLLTRKLLAFHLCGHGQVEEATTILRAHSSNSPREAVAVRVLLQFVDFIGEYPETAALNLVNSFEQSGCYLAPQQVADRILAAVESRRQFALIRLGDGEGAWLKIADEDEARFADLYETNRRGILRVWFASDGLYSSRSFVVLRDRLMRALQRTDVIGIPYGLRLANEYRTLSVRSVPSCVNILRNLSARLDGDVPGNYCGQDVHLDLHRNGVLRALFRTSITFGIVSCHPGLGYRLATATGARVQRMVIVPEEKSFSQIEGVSGMVEPHYPRVFGRVAERLMREARQVSLWLVAAGYLGKIYCDEVREAGGIALDVGSIVDGWCGKVTRPTLRGIEQFAL